MNDKIVVFNYRNVLAYATEYEFEHNMDYMFTILPNCRDFDEVKDYLETICNYDNFIVDKTEVYR